MRQYLMVWLIVIAIPYMTTIIWTGRLEPAVSVLAETKVSELTDFQGSNPDNLYEGPMILVGDEEEETAISVEQFLVSVLAAQIPADFELETIKAQAILARTYIYSVMEASGNFVQSAVIREEELDMDALSTEQMRVLWDNGQYEGSVAKLQTAVGETDGFYLIYEGKLIEPLFCYASAGKTRNCGDRFPYLKQAESPGDLLAENFRSLPIFELREFAVRINGIPDSIPVTEVDFADGGGIQIVERDSSGYVKQVQIGQKTYSGEEVQYALGLASPCFSFEYLDGKIRVICKGVGHGYGFSQFGANELAKAGKNYEELLKYYFQNVEIVEREVF